MFCCCNYWLFGYARSAIAMAVFTLGYCLLLYDKFKFNRILVAAIIMALSFFMHKSQAIALIGIPLIFVRLNRKTVMLSLCLLPFAVKLINFGFEHMDSIFDMNSSYYDMEVLQSKAERYMDYDKTALFGQMRGLMEFFNELTMYFLVISVVYFMSFKGYWAETRRDTRTLYTLMYALVYFALAAAFGGFQQSVYSYRIFNMSLIPAVLCLLLLFRDGKLSYKKLLFIGFVCFGVRVLESFVYELYVTFS